jgi:hypothetical protein
MTTNETEQLLRSVVSGLAKDGPGVDLISNLRPANRETSGPDEVRAPDSRPAQQYDAGGLAAEVDALRRVVSQLGSQTATTVTRTSTKSDDDSDSTAATLAKTLGLISGVGPIAAGLMAIFGGGSDEKPVVTMPFELPSSLAMNAGLGSNRQMEEVMYGADGVPRAVAPESRRNTTDASVPPIQINVSAMDSRSFLDHSDDIARAVREAMLHSHSLNDVISEI